MDRSGSRAGALRCGVWDHPPVTLLLTLLTGCAPAPSPLPEPERAEPPPAADPVPRGPDTITELYRDGFGAGSSVADFLALSVPRRGPRGPVQVVKVYVDGLDTPDPEVYFIDTARNETHWWFARELMGDAWSVDDYARRTYHRVPRPAAALNLVLHRDLIVESRALGHAVREPISAERGAEDAMPPELALRLLSLLQDRMAFAGEDTHRLLWLPPTDADQVALAAHEDSFRAAGIGWLDRDELLADIDLQILNPGVAYGTLRHLTPAELSRTVVSSRDLLLLSRPVNELPVVAGTITEELQTPLSHVAIASRARGTPNLALPGASGDARLAPLLGQLVRLDVEDDGFSVRAADLDEAEAHWAAGLGVALDVPPADLERDDLPDLADLGFEDSASVGVKAANVAELHHLLGPAAPEGFAVPFSAYDRFMRDSIVRRRVCRDAFVDCAREERAQAVCEAALQRCYAGALGRLSLRDYALALLEEPAVAADPELREAALDGLRFLVGHAPPDPTFAEALDGAVAARFGDTRMRLRSSTNAEDLPDFSGAGLYRSVSAQGLGSRRPSAQIRKVWASVWTWRAVEERAAWGIDHAAIAMGVLVHPATVAESANGVVVTADLYGARPGAITVNVQPGDLPVTNPEGGATPEVVVVWEGSFERRAASSLSPDAPVLDEAELADLYGLARKVQHHFAPLYGRPAEALALDLEVKRTSEGRWFVKQARPYPLPGAARSGDVP